MHLPEFFEEALSDQVVAACVVGCEELLVSSEEVEQLFAVVGLEGEEEGICRLFRGRERRLARLLRSTSRRVGRDDQQHQCSFDSNHL